MVLWGTGVLVVSIVASGVFWSPETSYSQCIDRLHPWFTNRVSCVGRAINCSELGIQGNKTDITSVLDTISPYLLGNLAFTDCPRLEIPSAIHNFSGIQTIAIHQSTLIEWNAEAAITNVTFPHLQSLQMLDSRVHCKPFGLTTHRFPSSFEWLRLKSTDVESFIHDVTDTWWSTHYFHCMKCGLRTLPRALDYIDDLMDLQVGNNSLTDIEVARLEHKAALRYLTVPWNPITTLPDEVWHLLDQLFYLDIQATNISTVTAAQAKYASSTVTIFAFGTPMCNGSVASEKLLPLVTCTEFAEVT
ncbi:TPA: hypothetical protein N0F65_003457 [Lagenidium giganteum]|uniref:Uncharacterized protein n=1 Tax=Lagenidium giganteum TaxID=4803 RepID=A0AAV2YKV3_9STRA|nr:TPA: hypothetical protein N0F65_003457 [Lagenidium giganteum]